MLIKLVTLLLVSMLPIIELRGGIPIGLAMGFDFPTVYAVCVVGNLLPIPILILFAGKVLRWGANWKYTSKICTRIIDIGNQKISKINMTYLWWALCIFVAIPLPGTGAWSGSLIATLLQMDLKKAFSSIAVGVLLSGLIMGAVSFGAFSFFEILF